MLTRLEVENFRAIEKLAMEFETRLTVIVGPNGSGKTSILRAIKSLGKVSGDDYRPSFKRLGSNLVPRVRLLTSTGGIAFNPEFPDERRFQQFVGETTMADMPASIYLHFDYERMSRPSLQGGWLSSDGSNLAAVLAALKLNKPDDFNLIEETFRQIIPQVVRIRFDQVPLRGVHLVNEQTTDPGQFPGIPVVASGFQLLFDTVHTAGVPADSASEGTLLSLAIVTAIVMRDDQFESVVLIDDLDASLHPSAQKSLIVVLRNLLQLRPHLQIIATSHSPYLLHSLEFDEVRLTTLRDDGTVACGRLMDHPDFDRWKDEMTPGEMWSLFGEKWIANPPAPEPAA